MSLIRKRKFYLSSLIVAVVALLATVILWPGINVSASNTYLSIEVGLNTDQQIDTREEKPVTEKAERIDEKNVVEGIAVYKLQPVPEYVKIGNQTINATDVLSAESALKESRFEETKWTKQEQELLALADQIRAINQPRMHATVKLPDTITPAFSGASNELLANLKVKGIDYVYSYVWVDGAEKAQGEIVIPDHYRLKRVFTTKGDKNNPEVIDVPEYQKGAKRPYYIRDVGKTITIYVDGFSGGGGEGEGSSVATIDSNQDYDIIHTLSFNTDTGNCAIRMYRGSTSAYSGTVYYRAGTSGNWTSLSVSGTTTTFPISATTMQVAHDWNKSDNNYMTASFYSETKLIGIDLSQKAVLSGAMGNSFMFQYAYGCSNLTSLAVPDTSGLTSVGNYFMYYYANGCSNLTSLAVPDTSDLTSVGNYFMRYYANGCSNLTSLAVPDTSGLTSVGNYFLAYYAYNCPNLTSLGVPDTSGLESVGDYFMRYYARGCFRLESLGVPDTSSLENTGTDFMYYYANSCTSLAKLLLPKVGWFATHDVSWDVPSSRLGYLQGVVLDSADLAGWKALTAETKTLYINYIQDTDDVILGVISEPSIEVSPTSKAFGVVAASSTYYAKGSAPSNPVADGDCTFTITNSGDACDLDLKVADFTGGTGWNIVSTSPGADEARITAYYSGQNPANGLVLSNSDQEFYDGLAASGTLKFDFKLETGSSFSFGNQVSTNITVTAVAED